MTETARQLAAWWETSATRLREEDGFQTAEAIGIAAVGLLVLVAVWGVLEVLGVDVINWMRDQFGVPASSGP